MSSSTCPSRALGCNLVYTDGISAAEVEVVREGDAVLLPEGYHPNVAIPGANAEFCLDHGGTSRSHRSQVGCCAS